MKRLVILILVLMLFLIAPKSNGQSNPDVIIFLVDDAGFGSFSPYNNQVDYTPNIQQLAEQGTLYTRVYHPVAVCVPTRYALLTGYSPTNQPEFFNHLDETRVIDPAIDTLPEQLQNRGYKTSIVGKWQLGDLPEARPEQHGFEYASLTDYIPDSGLLERQYNTHYQTISGLEFIRQTPQNQPLFLLMAYTAPHTPHYPFWDGVTDKGLYADSIYEIDWSIGEILRQVESRQRDTLIVFLSDNGPRQTAWVDSSGQPLVPPGNPYTAYNEDYNDPRRFEGGSSANHFGWEFRQPIYNGQGKLIESTAKNSIYEAGVRVPMIIKWSGGAIGINEDLHTTTDIMKLVLSGQMDSHNRIELYYSNGELGAIVEKRWKYFLSGELYDLEESAEEVHNVSGKYPEIILHFTGQKTYLPSIFSSPVE